MWTRDIEKDPEARNARAALEANGFRVDIKNYGVILRNKRLGNSLYISSRREFLDTAHFYAGINSTTETDDTTHRAAQARQTSSQTSHEDLQATIKHLRERGQKAVQERDSWEARALAAEARIDDLLAGGQQSNAHIDRRFDILRRYLAREFHPDHCTADGMEKLIRAEIFKKLWPVTETIAKGGNV